MFDRVNIEDAIDPAKKLLTQLSLTPVLSNPFYHLIMFMMMMTMMTMPVMTMTITMILQ